MRTTLLKRVRPIGKGGTEDSNTWRLKYSYAPALFVTPSVNVERTFLNFQTGFPKSVYVQYTRSTQLYLYKVWDFQQMYMCHLDNRFAEQVCSCA